jgi:hypothetical protein
VLAPPALASEPVDENQPKPNTLRAVGASPQNDKKQKTRVCGHQGVCQEAAGLTHLKKSEEPACGARSDAGGIPESSRRLSEATPPEGRPPREGTPAGRARAHPGNKSSATPLRGGLFFGPRSRGVALLHLRPLSLFPMGTMPSRQTRLAFKIKHLRLHFPMRTAPKGATISVVWDNPSPGTSPIGVGWERRMPPMEAKGG